MEKVRPSFIVGIGMTKFHKPENHNLDYHELAAEAMKYALEDAKLRFDQVDQVYCGYVYGDSTSG